MIGYGVCMHPLSNLCTQRCVQMVTACSSLCMYGDMHTSVGSVGSSNAHVFNTPCNMACASVITSVVYMLNVNYVCNMWSSASQPGRGWHYLGIGASL